MLADETHLSWLLLRLQHSLQALALPADVQPGLLPDFVCVVDELALDFDHWCLCIVSHREAILTGHQRALLLALNAYLGGDERCGAYAPVD